jgi:O-succinylbenzoic acid--CoA ligase
MNPYKPHINFKINGRSFESIEGLLLYSKVVSKDVFLFLKCWLDNKDYVLVHSSGSTGRAKTIKLKKKNMVQSAIATGNYFDLPKKTKALLCLSPNYIAGKMMLVRALVLGWQLDIVDASSRPLELTSNNYDFCAMVPMQLNNSLDQLYRVKKIIVGGAEVSNELTEKLQTVDSMVYATYGMTETITHIAAKKLNHLGEKKLNLAASPRSHDSERSCFRTLATIKISTDNRGCLVIAAPSITKNKIVTNDLVELVSDREFKWLGRYDNIVNSGGVKLIPELIEDKLSKVIKERFFVTGIPDELLGEKLVLVIEVDKTLEVDLNSVKATLIQNIKNLSKYEIPKDIFYLEKFIETETKKIQRQKTLDLLFKK